MIEGKADLRREHRGRCAKSAIWATMRRDLNIKDVFVSDDGVMKDLSMSFTMAMVGDLHFKL